MIQRLIFLIVTLPFYGAAQTPFKDYIKNIPVRSIGPAVTSGRVTAIDVDEKGSGAIYLGAASGGVWKSTSGGIVWEPIFDQQPVLGIGAIKVDPINSNYVWVGTGEGNPRNSHTSGAGVFLSQDAGKSWLERGLKETKNIHRIVVDPSDHAVVYAAAFGNIWTPSKARGVYKTKDFGETWENILFVNDTVGCADLIIDNAHPQKLLAAMYHYRREPWHYQSGGNKSGLYLTNDGGKKWIQLSDKHGLPEGTLGRIGLAMAPSNTDVIYALIEAKKTGLYKSVDGGYHWELVTTEHINDRPFYYHELYVDPTNEYHLIYLHSTVSESFDGGKTWSTVLPYWGVHPDHHAFWWSATNPKHMMEGNDGGFNQSYDGGKNWSFAANLPLGQFYHINYDMSNPYHVYGGMQDNGSWRGASRHFNEGGIRDSDWQEIAFGDGFDVIAHPDDDQVNYAMSQGGYLVEINLETNEERLIKPVHPEDAKLRFNWNSAIAMDEATGAIYYGSQYVHKSMDRGASWKIISPDLTTNDTIKIQQSAITGGLTPDRTSAEMYCTILSIDVKGKNLLVGTDDGQIQMSRDGGSTWQLLNKSIKGLPKNAWISQVQWGKHDDQTMFVVANNYRLNDWSPYLFQSTDGGKSWINLALGKNLNGHCLSFVEDPKQPNLFFLGTEHGLYCSLDRGQEWNHWNQNFPNVAVQDLKIHPREGDLIIGTFGRSAFVIDHLEPLRMRASQNEVAPFQLFQVESQIIHDQKRPVGQRFPADGSFEGDNLHKGVAIVFYTQLDTMEWKTMHERNKTNSKLTPDTKWKEKLKEEAKIIIRNMKGDTLRSLTHTPDTCINMVHWNMDTKGIRWPSLNDPNENKSEPGGGLSVMPGKYEVVVSWAGFKDSSVFEIIDIHPGKSFDAAARLKSEEYYATIRKWSEKYNVQMQWVFETERSIGLAKGNLLYIADSLKKPFLALTDSLVKEVSKVKSFYFLPDDAIGIQDDSDKIGSYLWMSLSYANSKSVAPGQNAERMIAHLAKHIQNGIDLSKGIETGILQTWLNEYNRLNPSIYKKVTLTD